MCVRGKRLGVVCQFTDSLGNQEVVPDGVKVFKNVSAESL